MKYAIALAYATTIAVILTVSYQSPAVNFCPEAQAITTGQTGYSVTTDGSTPTTASTRLWAPIGYSATAGSSEQRTQVFLDPTGYATWTDIKTAAPSLVPRVLDEVQAIRRQALSQAIANAGVAAVYAQNYEAATAYLSGTGDSTAMQNGMTATIYLQGFATAMGLSVDQYAALIMSEYQRMAPAAYAVEKEYLRLTYTAIPAETDLQRLLAYPAAYRAFCGL